MALYNRWTGNGGLNWKELSMKKNWGEHLSPAGKKLDVL